MLRIVVADDEPLVRERIRTLLAERADVTLLAECGDGESALRHIQDERPDLALLDIQMPVLDGFEVAEALTAEQRPAIVYVTAYDEYAVRAFEVNAVDYLMKPIEPHRLHAAIDRTAARLASPAAPRPERELAMLLHEIRRLRGYPERLVIRDGQRMTFVAVADIHRVEAAGNYVRVFTATASFLMRDSMKAVESRLDPHRFVRIHRSLIVSIDRIAHMEPHFHGEYVLTLRDGTRITSSRSYGDRIRELFR